MAVRSLEYQRERKQEKMRTLHLALEGVRLAIGASGAAYIKEPGKIQRAFRQFLNELLMIEEPPQPERKFSLAALKFKYGSRWRDHLDELREEDRDKVST